MTTAISRRISLSRSLLIGLLGSAFSLAAHSGSVIVEADAIIVTLSDRGRSRPWRLPFDPASGAPRQAVALANGDSVCYQMAVAGGRVAVIGALGDRAMELMEVRDGRFRTRTRAGSAWQRR